MNIVWFNVHFSHSKKHLQDEPCINKIIFECFSQFKMRLDGKYQNGCLYTEEKDAETHFAIKTFDKKMFVQHLIWCINVRFCLRCSKDAWMFLTHIHSAVRLRPAQSNTLKNRKQDTGMKYISKEREFSRHVALH